MLPLDNGAPSTLTEPEMAYRPSGLSLHPVGSNKAAKQSSVIATRRPAIASSKTG
jgi:hypothetical protein